MKVVPAPATVCLQSTVAYHSTDGLPKWQGYVVFCGGVYDVRCLNFKTALNWEPCQPETELNQWLRMSVLLNLSAIKYYFATSDVFDLAPMIEYGRGVYRWFIPSELVSILRRSCDRRRTSVTSWKIARPITSILHPQPLPTFCVLPPHVARVSMCSLCKSIV